MSDEKCCCVERDAALKELAAARAVVERQTDTVEATRLLLAAIDETRAYERSCHEALRLPTDREMEPLRAQARAMEINVLRALDALDGIATSAPPALDAEAVARRLEEMARVATCAPDAPYPAAWSYADGLKEAARIVREASKVRS